MLQANYVLSWEKDGVLPSKASDFNGVLTIPNLTESDLGTYTCIGSEPGSSDRATATISFGSKYKAMSVVSSCMCYCCCFCFYCWLNAVWCWKPSVINVLLLPTPVCDTTIKQATLTSFLRFVRPHSARITRWLSPLACDAEISEHSISITGFARNCAYINLPFPANW